MNGRNKYKFIAAVAALFLVPFLILSRHFIYGERELEKKDVLRYLELRTLTGAGIISDVLNLNYSLSRLTASAKGREGVRAELQRRVKENPFIYSELALLGPSGSELARYSAEKSVKARLEYAKSQVFAEARQAGGAAGAVEYGEYTPPALVLCEARPEGAKPEYYLAGRLSLAYLGEVVRMMGKNSSGNFGLVDGGGQIIADSMSMSIVKPGLKAPPEVVKMLSVALERADDNFSSEVYFRGRVYLVSVSAVGGTRWWMYEIMDAADMPSRRASAWAVRVVVSGILLILAFSVLTWLLALRWLKDGPPPASGSLG
ncbi:MAG: cache domain-containing protein [Elusimicrobiales bacterium]|nr:cache domain-containing protein [Elusimicrobiales bacterium]